MDSDPAFVRDLDAAAARGDAACQAASTCLQAMRSVICQNRCANNAAAYFAATVAALQKSGDAEAAAAPLLLILRRALPALQASVAGSRLNDVVAALAPALRCQSSDAVVRQALVCLTSTAEACYNANGRPNRKVLKPAFALLSDSRTTVRRQAELSAVSLLKRAADAKDQQTIDFAVQHLTQMLQSARSDKKASAEEIPAQRAVSLLRAISKLLPDESLGDIFAALTRLPALLGQHPCCSAAFEFAAEHLAPEEQWDDDDEMMPVEADPSKAALAIRFLPGLVEVPITLLNITYVGALAQALAAAVAAVCRAKQAHATKIRATQKILSLFAEQDPGLLRAAREACTTIFQAAGEGGDEAFLQELLEAVRPLLRFEAKGSWCQSLPAVTALFAALGGLRGQLGTETIVAWTESAFQRAKPLVLELIQARDNARGGELNVFGKELAECIGAAVSVFGPSQVLSIAPLELLQHSLMDRGFEQKSRSWLLLVLKDSCKQTQLSHFSSFFIPLASALKAKAGEAGRSDAAVLEKKYLTLLEQVWALLPGFCTEPLGMESGLLANGGQLAKQMVAVLQGESELRDYIWVALRRCGDAARQPSSALGQSLQESNRRCLRTLSNRVMPEMFNVYLKMHSEMEGQDASRVSFSRQQALAAIESFSEVVDSEYVGSLFKSIVAKWLKATTGQGEGTTADDVPALGDLANALVPHLAAENLELVLRVFAPAIQGGAAEEKILPATQRAGYRALAAVMANESTAAWPVSQVTALWRTLQDARQSCTASALKARVSAIQGLLSLLEKSLGPKCTDAAVKQEYMQCLSTIMPEVLFHLRDQSTAVRDSARESLHIAATTAMNQELQTEVITLVSAGLAGLSRHAKAAALDALSRLLYEHHSKMSGELQRRLVEVVLLLLEDRDAQVWRAALKFTKVVVFVLPKEGLIDQLPKIMRLFESRFLATAKMMIRAIVERLAKVIPEEMLEDVFPKAHLPLLRHVQKQLSRKGRPKTVREKAAEEEPEEPQEEEKTQTARRRGKKQPEAASWEAFKAGDEGEADAADPDGDADMEGAAKAPKKRGRAEGTTNEPPMAAAVAHSAVQALLDAWEAESDSEDGQGKRGARSKRKRGDLAASTWIQEDGEVPLDFMSADAAHSVLTVRAPPSKRLRGTQVGTAGAENKIDALRRSGLRFAPDGRLVVDDAAEEKGKDEAPQFTHGTTSKPKALSQLAAQRKARAEAKAQARAARRGVHVIKGMESYKPGRKKAQGDAKRKGAKLEPFAYVRLNPKVTKEKFKTKATETFSKVIKGAKKGVLKGKKARARDQKMKQAKEVKKKKQARRQQVRRTAAR